MKDTAKIQSAIEKKLTFVGRSGREHDYVCPWCQKNKQYHRLHISYEKAVGICHGCSYGFGRFETILRDLYGGVPSRIARWLSRPDITRDVEKILATVSQPIRSPIGLPESFVPLTSNPSTVLGQLMLRYIVSRRGYTFEDAEQWGVGYCTDRHDPAFGYLIFPYYMGGRVVYWQARRVMTTGPKNYNPAATFKESILYGYDQAVGQKVGMLVEGPLDAWAWGPGALALTSKYLHEPQIRAIRLLGFDKIIVCMDGDAKTRTLEMAHELRAHMRHTPVGYLLIPGKKDPDDLKHQRLHRLAQRNAVFPSLASDVSARVRTSLRRIMHNPA